jgi:hypothetical protein
MLSAATALPGLCAALVYKEPLTGTVITFPSAFAGGQVIEHADHRGKIYSITAEGYGQIDVSVRETGATSIMDVLRDFISEPEDAKQYELLDVSENTLAIFRERESFGEKKYHYHRAWLLNDGSYLYVGFVTDRASNKSLYKELACEFGTDGALVLKTGFQYPKDVMAGHWRRKDDGKKTLQIYGQKRATLLRFKNEETSELTFGHYDGFWEKLRVWALDGKGSMRFNAPDEVTVTHDALAEFAGTYSRIETVARVDPVVKPAGFRGEWENDTIYCILRITRGGLSILQESSWRAASGYNETENGLELHDGTAISRTENGGLKVSGIAGTFYRAGEGKGHDRFAAFAPFKGNWTNPTTGFSLSIQDGAYAQFKADGGISGSMGGASVRDGKLYLGESEAVLDPKSGKLTVAGMEGVYEREAATPPKSAAGPPYVLEARNADLSKASDVIVEPRQPPFNLGGWHGRNTVTFHVDVKEAGDYRITLRYSKQEHDGDPAPLRITAGGKDAFSAPLPNTGKDWSRYVEYEFCTLPFPAGKTTLSLESTQPRSGSYVMNLRSVTLSPSKE